jgi:pimeloyl-ACP methyl ester carboxylesterase
MLAGYLFPLFFWMSRSTKTLENRARLASGLIIVLPGIEGESAISSGIAQGLYDAQVPCAVVMHDWTTGIWPFFFYHLRARRRNRREARKVAKRIVEYQENWPGRPVFLVGHSGGGALAVWILESLPVSSNVDAVILLAPALAPAYNLAKALSKTHSGIWNFYSWLDIVYLAVGTVCVGTFEGSHCVAAGNRGFLEPTNLTTDEQSAYRSKLFQERYRCGMLKRFHLGGHFGCTNRVFVSETIGPLLDAMVASKPSAP